MDCTVDGVYAASTSDFFARDDLAGLGFPDPRLGYRIFIPQRFADGREHDVEVIPFKGGLRLAALQARLTIPARHPNALNPRLRLDNRGLVTDWDCKAPRGALSARREYSKHVPFELNAFTRFVLNGRATKSTQVLLRPHLDDSQPNHAICVIARSLTGTALHFRAGHADETVASERLPLFGSWSTLRLDLAGVDFSEWDIVFHSSGIAIVDIAYASTLPIASDEPLLADVHFLDSEEPVEHQDAQCWSYRPSDWDHGVRFTSPQRGEELATGWFFDCRNGSEHSFHCRLATDPVTDTYALQAHHESFTGYSRISARIQRTAFLSLTAARLYFHLEALDPCPERLEIILIGRGAYSAAALWRRSLELTKSAATLSVDLRPEDLDIIRARALEFPFLELGSEFLSDYNVRIYGFEIEPVLPNADPSPLTDVSPGFEDERIGGQAEVLVRPAPAPNGSLLQAKVDVIVPVFNAAEHVAKLLDSLGRQGRSRYRVIIVDDASGLRTARIIDRFIARTPGAQLIRHEENKGYTKSINNGIQASESEVVVILNSDTVVPAGWAEQLVTALEVTEDTGIAGPLSSAASWQSLPFRFEGQKWMVNSIPGGFTPDEFQQWLERNWEPRFPEIALINGFCQGIRRAVIEEIGVFDEDNFPMGYGEENDFCLRAREAGWRIRVADNLYIYHAKSKTFRDRRSELAKQGSARLREKYPRLNWAALDQELREHRGLAPIRELVERAFFQGDDRS